MKKIKLLRVIRLDESDLHVYEVAAQPGEWAVPGTFAFWDLGPRALAGKVKQAFAHGFLGIGSFGRTTLVTVAEIDADELDTVTQRLAAHLVEHYRAPNIETAMPAAQEEIDFAISLCDHDVNTLLAIERDYSSDKIMENFKVFRPPSDIDHDNLKLWGPE